MQTPQCGSTAEASCAPFFVVFARKVRPRALSDNERGNTNDKRRWTTTRRSRSRKFATHTFDCIEFEGRIQRSSIKMLQDLLVYDCRCGKVLSIDWDSFRSKRSRNDFSIEILCWFSFEVLLITFDFASLPFLKWCVENALDLLHTCPRSEIFYKNEHWY